MKKTFALLLALLAVFALTLTACGGDSDNQPGSSLPGHAQSGEPGSALASWTMSASTWSSPNGATVHISAVPAKHTDGQTATFEVRLEGTYEDSVLCRWENGAYTASLDLNAKDGYCYFVIVTEADGTSSEVGVNLPASPYDESLINMKQSLESYCNVMPAETSFADGKLTIVDGTAQIQPPRITNQGETITCAKAELVLSLGGQEVSRVALTLPETRNATGGYDVSLAGVTLEVPSLEDDQQVALRLEVELSNGQFLSDDGAMFTYLDGALGMFVG